MPQIELTSSQLTTLKTDIQNDNSQVFTDFKADPNNTAKANAVADAYNLLASPAFSVWRSAVTRAEVYFVISPANTAFDFSTYKAQAITEQNAWTQMFMGDNAPFNALNFRNGVFSIFSGSNPQNAQRAHIFAIGRRNASRIEKLFAVAPANLGGITVGPNNGNTTTDALGSTTNPAVMAVEGTLVYNTVQAAWFSQ